MLVLHAFWTPETGAGVWAEDSEMAVTSPSQALRQSRPHPFAASAATLADLVGGAPQMTAGEVLALAISHPDDLDLPLELTDVTADGWLGALVPLTELLDVFYVSPGKVPPPRPVASGASLLDQLPVAPVTVRGMPLAAALRPAYDALTEGRH